MHVYVCVCLSTSMTWEFRIIFVIFSLNYASCGQIPQVIKTFLKVTRVFLNHKTSDIKDQPKSKGGWIPLEAMAEPD